MRSMEYCTGLFVWGLEVCAHLVVGGVCVAEVRGGGLMCGGLCVFVPETCRAKNISIKLTSCIKLAFHFISCLRIMFRFYL